MGEGLKQFWNDKKDIVKNVIIVVAVPLAVLTLYGVNRLNKVINENDLHELFYGDEEEEA